MATDRALALTLDIGTSSTRVLLWDTQGREVEGVRAQIKYQMHTTSDGGVEMPAEELETHVAGCIDQALEQAGQRAKSIRVVGMSTFWHSLLGLDAAGKPLTPIYNWADTRSAQAAQQLRARLDERQISARTGCMLHPSFYPAKLVWLRETQPDVYSKVVRWASPSEYLFGRWFDAEATRVSVSMASGTGLMNQARCEWDEETFKVIDVPVERLAPIIDLSEHSHGLQGDYATRWPALKEMPFFPAVGDGACGNVGSGCVSPERFAVNLGTSGAIRALYREEGKAAARQPAQSSPDARPSGLWRYRVDSHRPLIGAAFSDGGIVYEWMARTLQLPPADELERQIVSMPLDLEGPLFLPFLAGERSMGWNPEARAALTNINLHTDPVEILRGAMLAVALRFALAAQKLREIFPQSREIIASGGALGHSPAWTQMFADAIGQPVTLAEEPEASSRGAALLALEAAGLIGAASEAKAQMGRTFDPDPVRHTLCAELLTRQQQLYEKLIGTEQGVGCGV